MTTTSFDATVQAAVGSSVPGVCVLVVGREGVRARAAIGQADLGTSRPMTTDLVLPWFSMTKLATATAAIRLVEEGALDLDEPVWNLVPALQILRPLEWAQRITSRMLLQHTAGLANPIPIRWIHPADVDGPDPDLFLQRRLTKHSKLRFEPGRRSTYSNLGFLTLGIVMARSASCTFEEIVHREVLDPLKMVSTDFSYSEGWAAATGYHPRRSPMRLMLPRWALGEASGDWTSFRPFLVDGAPYGGLVGSVEDAGRFLQMHLADGDLAGCRIISASAAADMRRITEHGRRYDLGLGWFVPARRRHAHPAFVEHLGGGAGFFNVMRIYPSLGVGIVVMGNATKFNIDAVADLALGFC